MRNQWQLQRQRRYHSNYHHWSHLLVQNFIRNGIIFLICCNIGCVALTTRVTTTTAGYRRTTNDGRNCYNALSVSSNPAIIGTKQRAVLIAPIRAKKDHDNSNNNYDIPFTTLTQQDESDISRKRKRRKNKYENFSKVNEMSDPLDVLLEESYRLNQEITSTAGDKNKKNGIVDSPDISPSETDDKTSNNDMSPSSTPPKIFPDVKGIDPYDPQTFGYIFIGTIIGAHGVHGWVKVQCNTDFPIDRLCTTGIRHIKAPNKRAPREILLLQGKHRLDDEYLIKLDDITDRDTAQKLRGSVLYIREEQKSYELSDDEYVVSDLVGSDVYLKVKDNDENDSHHKQHENTKTYVGIVGGVVFADDMCSIPGLGHDYLEIAIPRGIGGTRSLLRDEMVLIPMVPQIVVEVDIAGQRIVIDPPNGMLDLTYVKEEKSRIKGFLPPARNS